MSPTRYPLRHSATPNQNQANLKKKKLPRPGVEPGSLWPQHNILAVRPPKHLFFLLCNFLQSYWDWLPSEIQEYIVSFAVSQHLIDRRKNKLLVNLLREIKYYRRLKKAWGLGAVHCIPCEKCGVWRIGRCKIIGFYQQDYVYLGPCYTFSIKRINRAKSKAYDSEDSTDENDNDFRPEVFQVLQRVNQQQIDA